MKDTITPAKITETGYYELSNEDYHGDCCAGPSISASSVKAILADPSEYWRTSPFNPDYKKPETKKQFSVGTTAHTMLLEPELIEDTIAVVPNDMLSSNGALSTKAAKAFVAEQEAAGRTVVKEAEWLAVCNMVEAVQDNDVAMRAIEDGLIEKSLIVKDEETGIFLKARPDVMPQESGRFIVDLKSCGRAEIAAWEKAASVDLRYDIQGAMMMNHTREVYNVEPAGVMYVVVCTEEPNRVAIRTIRPNTEVGLSMLDNGWLDIQKAKRIFAECLETGQWPSPWDKIADLVPPDWRLRQIEKRLQEESYSSRFAAPLLGEVAP